MGHAEKKRGSSFRERYDELFKNMKISKNNFKENSENTERTITKKGKAFFFTSNGINTPPPSDGDDSPRKRRPGQPVNQL